ncbi:MAG: MFS transporter [Oscillospiraceae bacterium]|nr:MFS transporter [Oscillospiraceae bacterium]
MAKEKLTQSEIDGVQYRRAKLWQIILVACNALNGMAIYSLIGQASYAASIGFGISTLLVGGLLTFTRIFDAITDPLLAFLYDRVNTPFGKIRPLMLLGWLIQSLGVMCMFSWTASKGFGVGMFLITYMVYVIGYTIVNMTAQTLPALLTNDPRQRPTVGVWQTVFNYLVPMAFTIILNTKLLPKYGEITVTEAGGYAVNYSQAYLTAAAIFTVLVSLVGVILCCVGISAYDKPENFRGTNKSAERLKWKDMWAVLSKNKPLQAYIISASSDKIAQQAGSTAIVGTMLSGILIGNMTIATYLSVGGMLPSIIFAILGARYCGKHGNKEAIVNWAKYCIYANIVMIAFFTITWFTVGTGTIAGFGITMIIYILLTLVCNGFMMAGTTANTAFMADIIDYELDRSGKYIPAVVSGTYSLVDKIVSSFSALIATGCVALIGYTATMPQPGDTPTGAIFAVTMFLRYGLAILGWICTLLAMRTCRLGKSEMVEVQKRIEDKKAEAQAELFEEELHKGDPENA